MVEISDAVHQFNYSIPAAKKATRIAPRGQLSNRFFLRYSDDWSVFPDSATIIRQIFHRTGWE